MPARTGKGRQRKGREFERSILRYLWEQVGGSPPWTAHSRPDDGYRPPPEFSRWHLEMKRQERLNIWAALEQARKEAGAEGSWFAVIFSRARSIPYVAIPLDDWIELVRIYHSFLKNMGRRPDDNP